MEISASPLHGDRGGTVQTLHLGQVFAVVRRNVVLIAACGLVFAAAACVFAKTRIPEFTASGTVAIEPQSFAIPELQGAVRRDFVSDPLLPVRTEVQAFRSRELIQSVITKLSLARLPEFNPALRPPTLTQQARSLALRLLPALLTTAQQPVDEDQSAQDAVLRALVVSQDNRSFVIGLDFTARDPKLAADVVNTLIGSYLEMRVQRRNVSNQDANAVMLQRIESVRVKLHDLETQMEELRTKNESVSLRAGSVGQQQVEELATAAARAALERAQAEEQWRRASALLRQGNVETLSDVLASPTISKFREQENEASQRLAALSRRYGPSYPGVETAQATLEAARSQVASEAQRIVASLEVQLSAARAHEADAARELDNARLASVKAENTQAALNDLQQDVTAQRTLYQTLLQGAQQTAAQTRGAESSLDVRLINAAHAPVAPSSPNVKLTTGLGGMGGCIIGLMFAFLRRAPSEQVQKIAALVTSAGVPLLPILWGFRADRSLLARILNDPDCREAGGLRLLRGQLSIRRQFEATRSVALASIDDTGDAAEIALALAYIAAMDGNRVILVECGAGAPRLVQHLQVRHADTEPLPDGDRHWRSTLLTDQQSGVDLLMTSEVIPTANTPHSVAKLQNLLIDLKQAYDLAIFVVPPPGNARLATLAAELDQTILVVCPESAGLGSIETAIARFAAIERRNRSVLLATSSERG